LITWPVFNRAGLFYWPVTRIHRRLLATLADRRPNLKGATMSSTHTFQGVSCSDAKVRYHAAKGETPAFWTLRFDLGLTDVVLHFDREDAMADFVMYTRKAWVDYRKDHPEDPSVAPRYSEGPDLCDGCYADPCECLPDDTIGVCSVCGCNIKVDCFELLAPGDCYLCGNCSRNLPVRDGTQSGAAGCLER